MIRKAVSFRLTFKRHVSYTPGGYNDHTEDRDSWYFEEQVEFEVRGSTQDAETFHYNCVTGKFHGRQPRKPRRKIKDRMPEFPSEFWGLNDIKGKKTDSG